MIPPRCRAIPLNGEAERDGLVPNEAHDPEPKGMFMRETIAAGLALFIICGATPLASAATADACKECSDYRKRCMANYPGPTCKIDYDICIKACGKK